MNRKRVKREIARILSRRSRQYRALTSEQKELVEIILLPQSYCAERLKISRMNSVVILNWEDQDFADRVVFTLERQGFKRTEDYESVGSRIQVWTKAPADNLRGRVVGGRPFGPSAAEVVK